MPSKQSEAVKRRWEVARLAMTEAGGRPAVTAPLRAREQGLPLPTAAMLISPAVDLR
jgi:hypothetical protein